MELEKFKSQLKETIQKDFPGGAMEQSIKNGILKHRQNYEEYIRLNPSSSFEEWKNKIEDSVNLLTSNPGELLSIGLFLLALDEYEKQTYFQKN